MFWWIRALVKEVHSIIKEKTETKTPDASRGYNGLPAVMSTYPSFLKEGIVRLKTFVYRTSCYFVLKVTVLARLKFKHGYLETLVKTTWWL